MSGSTRSSPTLLLVATVSGTVHHFLRPYAMHFRSCGWRVDAAASHVTDDGAVKDAFDNVHELPLSRSIRDLAGIVRGEQAIALILDEIRPDIVHVHTPIASFVTRLAARRVPADRRPAVIYTAHGFHFHEGGRRLTNAVFLTAERIAGRWTDRLVVINDEDERAARNHRIVRSDRLVRMRGIGLDTVAVDPASVGAEATKDSRHRLGVPTDVAMFVIVGELNANKRQSDAIDALAMMRTETAHLVIIGTGPTLSQLEAQADRLEMSGRVHFSGFLNDVPAVLAGATALIATSAREGLSRSVMEALALEVPVIASNARGNRELVGDSGWIVATGDIATMAEKMDWISDHPDERQAMGRRGRVRMVEQYDIHDLILRHEALYRAVLAERDVAGLD